MNEMMTVEQLKEQLPDMPDDALIDMKEDIESDPSTFAEHVGLNGAAEFLAALLMEMGKRGLVDLSGPKAEKGGKRSLSRSLSTRSLTSVSSKAEQLPQMPPRQNRKARRRQESKVRKKVKSLPSRR